MFDLGVVRNGPVSAIASREVSATRSFLRHTPGRRIDRWLRAALLGGVATLMLSACGHDDGQPPSTPAPSIKVLSNRADLVSGGDALVEITLPAGVAASALAVNVGGRDVTSQFAARASANGRILGVVTGLANGSNALNASAMGSSATLTITNHAIGGPVFSGAQILPWVCATPVAQPASGNTAATNASGLTTSAVDAQCDIATEYKLYYKTTAANCNASLPDPSPPTPAPTNPCFKTYTPGSTPSDLATTTTDAGLTVPYIVRVERGTLNRGIFDIAVLYDPTTAWTAVTPQAQWNRKVVYTFGASTGQPRRQYRSEQSWTDDSALSRGFMVVDNSLTDSLYNSNRVLMSETLMMMKEHIVDAYGELKYLAGNGCSGGSIQQNTAANIYPGLLDGLQVACDFPDSVTTATEVSDCVLLVNAYNNTSWLALQAGLTPAQINAKKAAIDGHLDQVGCQSWNNAFGNANKPGNYIPRLVIDPTSGVIAPIGAARNNCELPAALVYDPATNPNGLRCTDADAAVQVWGTAPGTTRANLTSDNIGVQYGLKALTAGTISAEEFVTLNEVIGGFDADNNLATARVAADAAALPIAYRTGIVSNGTNLARVPIIDQRGYDEQGIHYNWRSFSERDRLDADAGGHGNQVIWRYGASLLAPAASGLTLMSFLQMDQWLVALTTSAPKTSINDVRTQTQVVAGKPATAFDFCYLTSDTTFSTKVTDQNACNADVKLAIHSSPHQVAGGPRTESILKCQLKPIATSDYAPATLSTAQLTRLQNVFPAGVCDWTKTGVGQQAPVSPLDYTSGPGGVPFPTAPVSRAS